MRYPAPYYPPPRRSGGGLGVLVLVTIAVFLAAPHAGEFRQALDAGALPLPALRLPRLPTPPLLPPERRSPGSGPRACPVAGRFAYGGGWGAPRDGGARRHQGVDLMAPAGTRLVAVEDGRIGRAGNDGGRAGLRLWLQGRSGMHYFYAHNRRNHVRAGQHVKRGQLVAEVGATGNAAGGAPHLHFELHPRGGRAVSADRAVRRWCR